MTPDPALAEGLKSHSYTLKADIMVVSASYFTYILFSLFDRFVVNIVRKDNNTICHPPPRSQSALCVSSLNGTHECAYRTTSSAAALALARRHSLQNHRFTFLYRCRYRRTHLPQ